MALDPEGSPPMFSVIIPVFNRGALVDACIRSVPSMTGTLDVECPEARKFCAPCRSEHDDDVHHPRGVVKLGALKLGVLRRRAPELARLYGLRGAVRVIWAMVAGRPVPVPGLDILLPADRSVDYHVTLSVPKIIRLAQFVRPGEMVFDLGAHAGLFSAAAVQRGARVVAVEPDPSVAALLRANTAAMDVEVVEAAVADHRGRATFWRVPESTQTSSLSRTAAEEWGAVEALTVDTLTLDDLVDRYGEPQVVKIDIQGGESAVLASARVVDRVRALLVEVTTLDPATETMVEQLAARLDCTPVRVNEVAGGYDAAFVRGQT